MKSPFRFLPRRVALALALVCAALPAAHAQSAGWQVVDALNAGRQAYGVEAITLDPRLQAAAEWHVHDMAGGGCFQREACDGTPWAQWFGAFYPADAALQYIGMGYPTAQSFVDALFASPATRQSLIDPRFIGAGAAHEGSYWSLAIGTLTPAVPEPATWLLAALGLAGIALRRRGAA